MKSEGSVRLEFSSGRARITSLDDINDVFKKLGARVFPLDIGEIPHDIQKLLEKTSLTPAENERLKAHLLLPRERLLEIISAAGREPQVAGGGALKTHVDPHDYYYPQLYIAQGNADYSRFERFHVNEAEDGTGVDEILQLLWGKGFEAHQLMPDQTILSLRLDCPSPDRGWILTYDGKKPHLATLSGATPGTKVLVQVIGAPRWVMKYQEDAPQKPTSEV